MSDPQSGPFAFTEILKAELDEINKIRGQRAGVDGAFDCGEERKEESPRDERFVKPTSRPEPPKPCEPEWESTIASAHKENLVGLAFSGGGIRSATFNLGVLQGLADLGFLLRVDYLSTVSGGGYIGGWLAAWTSRAKSFAKVQKQLAPNRLFLEGSKEPQEIRFLRMFSNYLTPKVGLFSGDTWAAAAIIARNIILNLVVLLASFLVALSLPRLVLRGVTHVQEAVSRCDVLTYILLGALIMLPVVLTMINMVFLDARTRSFWTQQRVILLLVVAPICVLAIVAAVWSCEFDNDWSAVWHTGVAYEAVLLLATILGVIVWLTWAKPMLRGDSPSRKAGDVEGKLEQPPWTWKQIGIMLLTAPVAGAFGGWLYARLRFSTECWCTKERLTYGVPLVLGIFLLATTLHIGLMGVGFPDRRREWCGRLGGWLLLISIAWLAAMWCALYAPQFFDDHCSYAEALAKRYLTATWLLGTLGGILAGKGTATGTPGRQNWKDFLAKAAPYVFVIGLVCWLSWGLDRSIQTMPWLCSHLWLAVMLCAFSAAFMAWRVDINQFSMHQLYRNRLVRCYLGASNTGRAPNRFTGLDKTDDLALKDLRPYTSSTPDQTPQASQSYEGPYPILNATLNLVKGQDLAWQQRKAESFVMTPLYCGYDVWLEQQDSPLLKSDNEPKPRQKNCLAEFGYRKTEQYAFPQPRWNGLNLGTAIGISGAAASPNMGFYTTAPVAFLMTVFNVRLGQWLGNPRHVKTYRSPTPLFGLTYLFNELFAGTDDEAKYVYLSDGGHFDNMGLYELVKRRCGLIILCDAEADCHYGYGGLGNAIRKCRIDLGIDIDLDLTDITPAKSGAPSKKHCALGAIHYENVDRNAPTGTIIYIKASLTGDEPADVTNYKSTCDAFPHESTIDQWFSESQFESYRKLGYHEIVFSVMGDLHQSKPEPTSWPLRVAEALPEVLRDLVGLAGQPKRTAAEPTLEEKVRGALKTFGPGVKPRPNASGLHGEKK